VKSPFPSIVLGTSGSTTPSRAEVRDAEVGGRQGFHQRRDVGLADAGQVSVGAPERGVEGRACRERLGLGDDEIARAGLDDRALEEARAPWGDEVLTDARAARRLPEDGDRLGVSSEGRDVRLDPLQRSPLVEQAKVARAVALRHELGQGEEA
jgi:hypothetical protein